MTAEGGDELRGLRIISVIAMVQGVLTVVGGLVLVIVSFGGGGNGGALFAGLVAAVAGGLLFRAARKLPELSNPSRRRLLGLEWLVLAGALVVGLVGTLIALADGVLALIVIVSLQFRSSTAGAFAVGFVGEHPPENLLALPRSAVRAELVPGQALLSVEGLRTHFFTNDGVVKAVDGVSFSVQPGETLGIVGESGCGKSITSLSIMRLLTKPGRTVAGRITFMGRNLLELSDDEMADVRGNDIAMIFQEPMTALNPVLKVGDQIRDSLMQHFGIGDRQARARIVELFEKVRIPSPKQRVQDYPHQLSGGMRQRVMIAMALACNPRLLIADEPTTALDVTIQAQILALLDELKRTENMGIIMITHDLGVIAETADDVSVMYAGKIVESASVYEVFARPKHPYTQGLLASMPSRDKIGKRLNAIQGVVPHPLNLPPGCSFAPRCPHRFEMCDTAFPALDIVEPDHRAACYLYTRKQDEVRNVGQVDIDPTDPFAEEVTG
jgi:oligopeptide/dipeptide ABC transporter ATP-binding protein